jgi:hypothetical protein
MPHPQFNALKHGCTARTPVLPGEDETLWREVEAQWFEDYEPRTHTSRTMVAEAALSFWYLARNRNRLESYERTLPRDVLTWTDQHHTDFARFTRYKTAADRAFSNAFKNLEYLRKARIAEGTLKRNAELQLEKLQLQMACQTERINIAAAKSQLDREKHEANERHRAAQLELQKQAKATAASSSSSTKKKKDTFDVAEQWLEITVADGVTTTEYIPTNEELLEELKKEGIVPKLVYRRMNFPNGIPPEYAWSNSHDPKACPKTQAGEWCEPCAPYLNAGAGIQRMTFDAWQEVIEHEALTPGQHAGPTGTGNLPRPKERGGDMSYDEMLEYIESLQPDAPDETSQPDNATT